MLERIWLIAVVIGILVLLLAIAGDGVGALNQTTGIFVGIAFIVAGFIVRRIRGRKAPPSAS